jgi:hypothetical protein
VRRAPDNTAVLNQQGLRRLVPHTQLARYGIGHVPVRLHSDDGICGFNGLAMKMGHQLVEGLGADAAGVAMFEQQEGPVG